jgi:hypothetical protein
MNAAFLPDFVRGMQRSYSNLAGEATDYLFSALSWLSQGSVTEVAMKIGLIAAVLVGISFAFGSAKAMGDKKASGTAAMWTFIILIFAGGLFIALVLMDSDLAAS